MEKVKSEFICSFPNCGKRYKKNFALKSHSYVHQKEKPFHCDFEGCSASYARTNHLARHVNISHSKPTDSFRCPRSGCVASFATEFSLRQHVNRTHQGLKSETHKLVCSHCSSDFKKEWQLQEHEASHTQIKPFRCEDCGETFIIYSFYKSHLLTHGVRITAKDKKRTIKSFNKKTYECDLCGESFPTSLNLVNHRKSTHPVPLVHQCDDCQAIFRSSSSLKAHKNIHNKVRQVFKCSHNGCSKSYLYPRNLRLHVRVEHEGEVYKCTTCQKELSSNQRLSNHMKLHQAERKAKVDQPSNSLRTIAKTVACRFSGNIEPIKMYGLSKSGPKPGPTSTFP